MMRARRMVLSLFVVSGGVLLFMAAPALAATPEVLSRAVSGVTPFSAHLEAVVDAGEESTKCHFQYGMTRVTEHEAPCEPEETLEGGEQGVSLAVSGLEPATSYRYRIVVKNAMGEAEGAGKFTTATAQAPQVESENSTAVTQTTASLSAVLNPELQPVTVCEFVLSGAIAPAPCSPSAGELGEGGEGVATGASLTGLSPNTEYQYKLHAENETGPSEGAEETFLTLPEPPAVSTAGTYAIEPSSATVSGSVNPGSSGPSSAQQAQDDTIYYFQYGGTSAYGKQTASGNAGEGASAVAETGSLIGLEPGTTYHYRIVASNDNANPDGAAPQTVYGQDETFTTPATPPTLSGVSVSGVTQSSVTITASLEAQGLPTRYELLLGATPGLLQPQASGETSGPTPISLSIGSLSSGIVYYYKLLASNQNGSSESEGTFTTAALPAAAAPSTLPALILYQTIGELDAKEANEDKGIPTPTLPLTNAQKLAKALKGCKRDKKKSKRVACVRHARKEFGQSKKAKK